MDDEEATVGVKASNDVKRIAVKVSTVGGFHQPQPFLMEQTTLKLRRDRFMDLRFLLCCPFPKKMMHEEVMPVQMHKHSKDYWNRFLITMFLSSDSTGTFFSCLFTSACGKYVKGSFLDDHYIQVVIKCKKGMTVMVKNC